MGEYLTLLNQTKNYVYNGRANAAGDTLKRLLNCLNMDYTAAKIPAEKTKIRNAITKLLPVLDELKKGMVTAVTISALSLDRSRLPAEYGGYAPKAPTPPTAYARPVPPPPPAYSQPAPAYARPVPPPSPAYTQPAPAYSQPAPRPAPQPAPAYSQPAPQPAPQPAGKQPKFKSGNTLMPLTFDDYIGQAKAKRSLKISIGAAKKTGNPLAHLLICSPYGLGKTTLVNIIANEMGMPFLKMNATNLKDVKSLLLYFSKLTDSCIVFIDEIHTLKKDVQTALLSIITEFSLTLIDEAGSEQTYGIPRFTLIGATTQAGELLKPFLNRFSVIELEDYTEEDKAILIKSKFDKLGYTATDEAIEEISRRCRGIPRTIETYVKGVIDVALADDETVVTKETTDTYFGIHEIDGLGLTKNDIKLLRILDEAQKPLALITIESKSGIQNEDIEYRYEPYLIKIGFVDKTERGRVITKKGRKYLHPDEPDEDEVQEPEGQAEADGENSAEAEAPATDGEFADGIAAEEEPLPAEEQTPAEEAPVEETPAEESAEEQTPGQEAEDVPAEAAEVQTANEETQDSVGKAAADDAETPPAEGEGEGGDDDDFFSRING